MAGTFELYKDARGEFRFRLKAGNGEKILASEGYKSKSSAENGIESVRKNAGDATRFEKKNATNGKPFFVLKAANHQVIGTSELYESDAARDAGIQSVARAADGAAVNDQTSAA
ncbi:MAG: YegP family protein [Parvularculaceae bacterium]|nr:YegP family protein [Parvularculaceae bacterium]